ncbi:MAG: transporter substrate-binding domain-containing protein, partial [Bacilli bacterium]
MKHVKKTAALLFTSALLFTGCAAEEQNSFDAIKKEGELKVGTEGTYPPFTYYDENNKLVGFDVEVAQEVGKRIGVDITFVEGPWDSLFAGLDAERFDMIANQVGIKPERIEKYDFSDPYIESSAALVTLKSNDSIKQFSDLKGKKTAQSLTSNYAEIAKGHGADIVSVEGFAQAIKLIEDGRVDATINDQLSVLDYQKVQNNNNIHIVELGKEKALSGL